jgi:hypothetical protein
MAASGARRRAVTVKGGELPEGRASGDAQSPKNATVDAGLSPLAKIGTSCFIAMWFFGVYMSVVALLADPHPDSLLGKIVGAPAATALEVDWTSDANVFTPEQLAAFNGGPGQKMDVRTCLLPWARASLFQSVPSVRGCLI